MTFNKTIPACLLWAGLMIGWAGYARGQERLETPRSNPELRDKALPSQPLRQRALPLPFIDDFYPNNSYPNVLLWEDDLVYVNATFPVEPPTIGVATFDGLNSNGDPYSILPDDQGEADLLTSRPIDLSGFNGSESIYLSFFWQPGGLGDKPDFDEGDDLNRDSLLLEFRDTAGNWDVAWVQRGDTMQPFQQEFIAVDDGRYLYGDFQFRFRAIGRLTGAFDHWHIDYVRLDQNRDPVIEQNIAEMAFQYWPTSLLTPYYAMPYAQFDSSFLADSHSVFIRNNFNQITTDIIDFYRAQELSTGSFLEIFAGPSRDVGPLTSFEDTYASFAIPEDIEEDTVTVRVTYSFLVSAEDTSSFVSNRNNRVVKDQVFSNFFAYDDATAEKAYILEVRRIDALFGQVALEYYAPVQDTLQAVRINFVNYNEDNSNVNFALLVWKEIESDSTEEEILYREDFIRVGDLLTGDTTGMLNGFAYVPILPEYIAGGADDLLVEGRFYIGFEINVDVVLPVGFDLNTDGSPFHFINLGQGWSPTQFDGSLMMNPVLGPPLPDRYILDAHDLSFEEIGVKLFPNPVMRQLNIQSPIARGLVSVISLDGRRLMERTFELDAYIDVQDLASGMYLLRVTDLDKGISGTSRFIRP